MERKNTIFNTLILLLLTFCIQFTDLKIGLVKITEFLLLGLAPLVLLGKLHRFVIYFLVFFTAMGAISLIVTSNLDFSYIEPSLLKKPYWITLGRYAETVTCVILCNISYIFFQSIKKTGEYDFYISRFIDINMIITIGFVFVYLLVVSNLISIDATRLVYDWNIRLRGYFAEGGPYGLMLSFFFILSGLLHNTTKKMSIRIFLFVVISIMAQSKAGILCCIVWIGIENFEFFKNKLRVLMFPILIAAAIGFYFLFTNLSKMYIHEIDRIKIAVKERPSDPNLIMGRISGFFITPNLIKENPVFGIGTGNYPLIRNNKEYRGFFPLPQKKIRNLDAHGYGGMVDIMVDNGLLGLLLFFLILGRIFMDIRREHKKKVYLLGFIILFMFGVQIYFMYPWVLLGILLVKDVKE